MGGRARPDGHVARRFKCQPGAPGGSASCLPSLAAAAAPAPAMGSLLAVKLGCLAALALLPLLCGLLPAALLRLRGAADLASAAGLSRGGGQSILSCAAGGVFLAACLLDIVPDSLADLREEMQRRSLSLDFPVPELVLALGFLLVLVLEHVVLDCRAQRSGEASLPLLPSPEGQHPEEAAVLGPGAQASSSSSSAPAFRALMLTLSLSFHSVFEGLAVGLQETQAKVLQLAVAILLHKAVIAVSLALLLLQSRLPLRWLLLSLATFALMSPLGLGLGILVTHTSSEGGGGGDGGSDTVRSALEGVAAGTFVYITFLEILPHELSSPAPGSRLPRVLAVLLGFSGMTALRFLG
ncbi:zinc transporter ZIP1-like [Sceloporus undulatus]|uniref:zinc transporter ZIP1-like n=1 Tax=Sceloporus undulatus TaxID=8520 RepID=UPI001C4B261B|nr:zinc transporter ZIP1-like [Sceloporus undulatus]